MNLTIQGRHLEITPPIRDYVEKKLDRVLRHIDNVIDASVYLSKEPVKSKAEVTLRIPNRDLHCEAIEDDLYAAIDILTDKIDRMVVKHKSKQHGQERQATSAKRMEI